jgi:TonB family protein
MEMLRLQDRRFKRAVILSVTVHMFLFIMLIVSPYLPKPSRKGMIHYVELTSFGGGGGGRPGGGGGGNRISAPPVKTEQDVETQVPERQSLRDLTTPAKLEESRPPAMTHPVDKPQRDNRPKPEKQAVIQKAQPGAKRPTGTPSEGTPQSGTGGGSGSRLGLGIGEGEGGFGFGEGFGGGGLSTFPYAYYVAEVRNRISNNWMTAQIRSGTSGNDYTEVRFRIFRDGRTSEPEILRSSDNITMKRSAIRAIRNASPFPPLPSGYTDEYLIVRLLFEHNK